MGNIDARFGMVPVRHLNGNPWNGATTKCYVSANYATALFPGDPVDLDTTTANQDTTAKHMTVIRSAMTDGTYTLGPIVSIEPIRTDLYKQYIPASTGGYVYVAADPDLIFEVRDDGGVAPTKLFPGQNAVGIFTHAGSTTTGISGFELDAGTTTAPAANASYPLFILGAASIEDNILGTRTIWEVLINMHRLRATGDGDGALGVTAA